MKGKHYEYVLVGGGVAAATVARRLLQANPATGILILEAGRTYEAKHRRHWWDYVTHGTHPYAGGYDNVTAETVSVGNTRWDFKENRVIAYGGSTLHWGGWSLRYKPEDFHLRTNTGRGADWPFGYETLRPYYYQAEQHLSVSGDDTESWNHDRTKDQRYPLPPFAWTAADGEMIQAFESLGIEPGRMPMARYRKCLATGTCKYCPVGARYTAQYDLDDLIENPRHKELIIRQESPATRIVMRSRRQAAGVEYMDSKGIPQMALADCVVICSGTYESPKLLLLSEDSAGKGFWPKGIGNDRELVGKYITSHSILGVRGILSRNEECWFQEYDFPTLMSRTYDTPEYQQHGKLFIFKNRKEPSFDFADKMIAGLTKNQIEVELRKQRKQELQAFLEEKGSEGNYLTVGHGKSRWGLPNTRVHFDRTSADLADAHSRLALMERVIKTMGYEIEYSKVEDPGGHHASGTCRMASHPDQGVTDADLRVHDTDNLYICSNAVLPTGSAVNPTLTLTALAMRLGDHLVGATAKPVGAAAEPAAVSARTTASSRESSSINLNESVFG